MNAYMYKRAYTYAQVKEDMSDSEKKVKTPKTREKKPLTKKQKTILIAVLSAVAVLLIAGIIVLVVVLTTTDGDGKGAKVPSRKIQYEYYVDIEDTVGFKIKDDFREDVPLKDFERVEVVSSDNLILTDDLTLKVGSSAEVGNKATYNFTYKGVVIAVVNVFVVDADAYLHTTEELLAVSQTEDKTYVARGDFDFTGIDAKISKFIGTIHFNHHEIKGYNASGGGLFTELQGATITGLDMVEVRGSTACVGSANLGVVADYAHNSKIRYSTISGEINVTSTAKADDVLFLGGFVGYASALKRKDYVGIETAYVHLVSFLDIKVSGTGDFRIGGLIGGVKNASLRNSFNYGNVDFSVESNQVDSFKNLYLGGMVGALTKEYDVLQQSYLLDESAGLYSYANINVSVSGGGAHNLLNVGGIFGQLENHSIVNCTYGGKMDVNLTRASLNAGGIIGKTNNSTMLKMNVRGIIVKGEMSIYSLSSVYAGGIIGEGYETQYSAVDKTITPTIDTDKSKVQGVQEAKEYVAKIK